MHLFYINNSMEDVFVLIGEVIIGAIVMALSLL